MRLYSDRPDILTPGRWYRCPPTAQPVGWTAFFARRNELEDHVDAPVGEVYQRQYGYSKSPPNPRLTGTRYCGSAAAWTQGVTYATGTLPVAQNGLPVCCGVPPRTSLVLSGVGARVRIGTGGLVLGSVARRSDSASVCTCMSIGATAV